MTGLEWCAVIIVIQLGCIIVIQLIWGSIQLSTLIDANNRTVAYQRESASTSRQILNKALALEEIRQELIMLRSDLTP
jgi:Tfp pilus assembly protein PilO